jgi:uncharacterized protein (DUF4415 family)
MPTPEPHETLTTGLSMAPPAGPVRPPAQGRGTRAGASPVLTGRPYIGYGGTMSDKLTRMRSGAGLDQSLTDWDRLDALTDDEIAAAIRDDPDAFEPEPGCLEHAQVVRAARPKQRLTLRLDTDLVDWFKAQGPEYQTRINAVLRAYVERARKPTA